MTWHNTSHHIASNDVTITWPDPATDIKTSKHFTSKHKTSPPWNGRRLVHSKEMVWASRWSVALRAFYRQILSLTYSFFSLKLPPPACPGTTGTATSYFPSFFGKRRNISPIPSRVNLASNIKSIKSIISHSGSSYAISTEGLPKRWAVLSGAKIALARVAKNSSLSI